MFENTDDIMGYLAKGYQKWFQTKFYKVQNM